MSKEETLLNGRYQLLQRIGSGGMAIVYKAQDMSLGRVVAIKMLHEGLTGDENFLRRFHREAHAAANLTHPNVVTVHDIGQDRHRHYIVMEYVDGKTLKEIIRDQYRDGQMMPIDRALDLAIQICAGVGYAHRANLVHCDVKPQNVLVTRDNRVKVADFGIARAVSQASLYQESQVWGTPQYFSPEQATGSPATPASDVYAIGIILFEMLSGRLPFQADSYPAVAIKHISEEPPLITELNPAVPRQLEMIINKVLAKEPSGRYRTAGQLGRILSTYRQSSQADTGSVYPLVEQPAQLPPSEQKTQIFQHTSRPQPDSADSTATRLAMPPDTPVRARQAATSEQATMLHVFTSGAAPGEIDWMAVGLGITALIALIGLIPLWYFVYRAWAG